MAERIGGRVVSDVDDFCAEVWPRLASSLGLYCHDVGVGEELAQEALARAWARWDTVRALDSPEAWVFRVGLNLARSRFRRARAERRAISRMTPTRAAASATDAMAVRAAVASLPDRQRAAVVLRYFADLPVVAAAEALDCAQGTVRSLTSQGIERLRRDFEIDLVDEDLR